MRPKGGHDGKSGRPTHVGRLGGLRALRKASTKTRAPGRSALGPERGAPAKAAKPMRLRRIRSAPHGRSAHLAPHGGLEQSRTEIVAKTDGFGRLLGFGRRLGLRRRNMGTQALARTEAALGAGGGGEKGGRGFGAIGAERAFALAPIVFQPAQGREDLQI